MRSVLPALIVSSAVLALTAGCGDGDGAPAAGPASTPTVASTPTPTPTPTPAPTATAAAFTQADLAPKLLGALKAKGTFRVTARMKTAGEADTVITADLRLKGDDLDLRATSDGLQLIKLGDVVYLKDSDLTGSKSRPWAKLDGNSDDPGELIAAGIVSVLVDTTKFHEVIGGAAHATSFRPAGQVTVGGKPAQEYIVTVDVKKATAVNGLGDFITKDDAKTLPKAMVVKIAVDAQGLPVQLRFTLDDTEDGRTDAIAVFSRFGQKLTIAPPPAAKIGKLK